MSTDFLSFFWSLVHHPTRAGAVAPSSSALADLISSEITALSGPVIELGPGTGVFTRALLERGVREEDLTLVECRTEFVRLLQQRFPEARVLSMDAARLEEHALFNKSPVGAVISGLPLFNMSSSKVTSVLTGAFGCMRLGAAFYQFTYGLRCPVPRPLLDSLGLQTKYLGHTLINIPPASVYKITQQQAGEPAASYCECA